MTPDPTNFCTTNSSRRHPDRAFKYRYSPFCSLEADAEKRIPHDAAKIGSSNQLQSQSTKSLSLAHTLQAQFCLQKNLILRFRFNDFGAEKQLQTNSKAYSQSARGVRVQQHRTPLSRRSERSATSEQARNKRRLAWV